MQKTDPSNHSFQLALKFVNQTGKHIFLTGKAGTGKTTFLRYIRDNCYKKMVVLAPTGVAAINAGGVTIHSFFQLPFGPFLASHRSGWNEDQKITNQHTLLKNIRFPAEKRKLIEELDMIVIDEASMMRCDMLDAIDQVLRHFRKKPHEPFGGIQMLYIGDLYQLPPVTRNNEWELLREHYQSPFFFDAQVMQQARPVYIELKKIYRQSDAVFIDVLNNIRNNRISPPDFQLLQSYHKPDFIPKDEDNYIVLTSHNARADEINKRKLGALIGELKTYTGTISGEFNEKSLPVDMELSLRTGAQIMFLKNDKGEKRRYFNGKIAVVTRLTDEDIYVQFPGSEEEMEIEKETWRNIRYRWDEETAQPEEEEIGTYSQFPIRLAWAITIHKSQGLTFEKAIIDAGASFAAGQVYVALSRLTSLEGLVLYSPIRPESVSVDKRVALFTAAEPTDDELIRILEAEQLLFANRTLLQSFEWHKLLNGLRQFIDGYKSRKMVEKEKAQAWAMEILESANRQAKTAERFLKQLRQLLLETGDNGWHTVLERITAAVKYFCTELEELENTINQHRDQYTSIKKSKKYRKDLELLSGLIERKKRELVNAVETTRELPGKIAAAPA